MHPAYSFVSLETMQNVGRLVKIVGSKRGIVTVWHDPFIFEQIPHQEGDFLFVAIDGLPVPFQIRVAEGRADNSAILYFEELHDGITAAELTGCELYLPADQLLNDDADDEGDEEFSLEYFVGCTLQDQRGRTIGQIVDYEQYSLNMLLVVERDDESEVLIPFHPELVHKLPTEDVEILQLEIADGLLDAD